MKIRQRITINNELIERQKVLRRHENKLNPNNFNIKYVFCCNKKNIFFKLFIYHNFYS